eukprot:XP_027299456.1 citramalyl-CoA lyase, mitochondrial isoform X4 [Anas platyrhynchos]
MLMCSNPQHPGCFHLKSHRKAFGVVHVLLGRPKSKGLIVTSLAVVSTGSSSSAAGQEWYTQCEIRLNSPLPAGVPKLSYHFASSHKYVPRRAVLYVPADDEKKIRKIPSLNVDCAVLDCEDGVALNRKREARLTVVKTLEEFDFGHAEKCVRINSVSSGLAEEDLETLLQSKTLPSSMMLPKVENVEEIRWFADRFVHHLKGRTLVEPMNFIPFVETAVGLLNFKAVCEEALKAGSQVGFHLDAVVFGGEDFRASIGATSSKETHDILYARQKIIVTAKAFGLQAIDLVYIDFRDEDGLRRQSREGASMGFTGSVYFPREHDRHAITEAGTEHCYACHSHQEKMIW